MNVNLNTAGIGEHLDRDIESAPAAEPTDTRRAAATCAPGFAELKGSPVRSEAPEQNRVSVGRKPETTRRLHRLRHELRKISPPPTNREHARSAIIDAMARAELWGWTVPELHDPCAVRLDDGAIRISLISHAIIFCVDGSFRIVDLAQRESIYFEMMASPRRDGR
ncbi:hypothetical protein EPN42_15995 [bacterium]|nr:MAG: hypothetical protein EPN42_15995 [bacterium]